MALSLNLKNLFLSLFIFLSTFAPGLALAESNSRNAEEIRRNGQELFLTQKLKLLEDEYAVWEYKKVILQRHALKTGLSYAVAFIDDPRVRIISGGAVLASSFYVIIKAIAANSEACGCFIIPVVGAAIGSVVVTTAYEGLISAIRIWYKKEYSRYFAAISHLNLDQLEDEYLTIQGALFDLGRKIERVRVQLYHHHQGNSLPVESATVIP